MMPYLVWNVRGLGTSHTRLWKFVKQSQVGLVAILKPFQKEEALNRFTHSIALCYSCDNMAQGGKMWVMWNEKKKFEVVTMLNQMIIGWTS